MATRAKFVCGQVVINKDCSLWSNKESKMETLDVITVELNAVTSGSDENKKFFASTPTGSIKLSILRPEALSWFKNGKEYYVDFTEAIPPPLPNATNG